MAKKEMNWLGPVAGLAGQALGLLGQKAQDKRQLEQQGKLNEQAYQTNRRSAENQKALDLQMWKDTNYSAQVAEAKKAGMSISSLYGGSGASGATVGGGAGASIGAGSATDPSAAQGMGINSARAAAELALLGAQKKNIDADTAIKQAGAGATGAQQNKTEAETTGINWENEVKKAVGSDVEGKAKNLEAQTRGRQAEKENAEIEAYLKGAFEGKASDDPNTPLAKAIKAGLDQTVQTLTNSKKTGNILEAQKAIENFKANLAKQGIAPDSPWWVKIVTTLLKEKFGIDIGTASGVVKSVINN